MYCTSVGILPRAFQLTDAGQRDAPVLCGVALRVALPILAAHLEGTFLTFVMLPAWMFRDHNPLLLTADGEFVAKNLVLVSATIVLITHATGFRTGKPELTGSGT